MKNPPHTLDTRPQKETSISFGFCPASHVCWHRRIDPIKSHRSHHCFNLFVEIQRFWRKFQAKTVTWLSLGRNNDTLLQWKEVPKQMGFPENVWFLWIYPQWMAMFTWEIECFSGEFKGRFHKAYHFDGDCLKRSSCLHLHILGGSDTSWSHQKTQNENYIHGEWYPCLYCKSELHLPCI